MADPTDLPRGSGRYGGTTVSGETYQMVAAAVGRGLSLNQIQDSLKGTPFATRRSALSEIRNEVLSATDKTAVLRNTPAAFKPSVAAYQQANFNLHANFRIYAYVDVPNHRGQSAYRYGVQFNMNDFPTRGEIDRRILEILQSAMQQYDFDVATSDIQYERLYRQF